VPEPTPEPAGSAVPEVPAPTPDLDLPMVPFRPDPWITDLVEKGANRIGLEER
jgi:hypothetical protein